MKTIFGSIEILVVLVAVVFIFERGGEKCGPFMERKAKVMMAIAGLAIAMLLNAGLLFDHSLMRFLQEFDFAFFLAFAPFCYGLWSRSNDAA